MRRGTPNFTRQCVNCKHSVEEGEQQVGSDEHGGGPEEHRSCKLGFDPSDYWCFSGGHRCPEVDDGEDYE